MVKTNSHSSGTNSTYDTDRDGDVDQIDGASAANALNGQDIDVNSLTMDLMTANLRGESANFTTGAATYYSVDTSGGDVTANLSTSDNIDGRTIHIKNQGSNTVNISPDGSATIEGVTIYDLTQDHQSATVVYNLGNDDWEVY